MQTKPMFNFGDYVYHAYLEASTKWVPCVSCSGSGYLTIILNGETFTIDCEDCKRGYEGSNGSRSGYTFEPATREGRICGVEKQTYEPFDFEYRISAGSNSSWVLKEPDVFATEEEALARAEELKTKSEAEEAKRLLSKTKPDKTWAWHVRYYQGQIREAQKTIERATIQLDSAKRHAKEKTDVS
jgi:hypothetical protein